MRHSVYINPSFLFQLNPHFLRMFVSNNAQIHTYQSQTNRIDGKKEYFLLFTCVYGIGFYYTEKLYRLSGKSERKCDFLSSFITLLFDILSHEYTQRISCFVFDVIYNIMSFSTGSSVYRYYKIISFLSIFVLLYESEHIIS